MNNIYTIGEVADILNVSIRDIRHYEYEGIISPSSIGKYNIKLYNDTDINKLKQIIAMKLAGFTIDDIKDEID